VEVLRATRQSRLSDFRDATTVDQIATLRSALSNEARGDSQTPPGTQLIPRAHSPLRNEWIMVTACSGCSSIIQWPESSIT
jgi:hypothetical protein